MKLDRLIVRTRTQINISTIQNNTLGKLQLRCNHVVHPSDGKARIKFVTSACTMPCNVLIRDCTRHTCLSWEIKLAHHVAS
jgi:hypothetical protein